LKIETTRFGVKEIDEGKIISVPYGMLGFPQSRRFVLFPHKEGSPFYWFQSADDPALAFVLTKPSLFVSGYTVDLRETIRRMAWGESENGASFELYVVVTIPRGSPEKMTANLLGPVLINNEARQAVQMVLSESPYSHQFLLFGNR
jgi:flagellar assembly factor FliW